MGFFPKLYETLVTSMGEENMDKLQTVRDDPEGLIRFTYELENFKKILTIKEAYPEKNPYEYKIKKEYANKAYQEGKDIDALYLYTQVRLRSILRSGYHQVMLALGHHCGALRQREWKE